MNELANKGFPTIGPNIKTFQILVSPLPMGQANLTFFGLGDDGKLYQWIGKDKKRVVSN